MKKFFSKNRGITLIALIVTIIVLLILAGVSLSLVAGGDGILGKAETSTKEYRISAARELLDLKLVEIDSYSYEENLRKATFVEIVEALRDSSDFKIVGKSKPIALLKEGLEWVETEISSLEYILVSSVEYEDVEFKITNERVIILNPENGESGNNQGTQKYTVTYIANGGECEIQNIQVEKNGQYGELPVPTREGYRFLGWYTDLEDGTQIQETDIVTSNVTLYAKWEEAPDLIAWYDGIDNTQDGHSYSVTTWADLTGNNTKGATINGATWTPNGLLFDGTDDWVNTNVVLMPQTDNFTIDIVFSLNSSAAQYVFGQNSSVLDTNRTGLALSSSQLMIWNPNTDMSISSGYNPKVTEKVNITYLRNNENIEIWLNGQKVTEKPITEQNIIYQGNTVLGRWGMYDAHYLNGVIYSVKAYNKELTSEEIEKNYKENDSRFKIVTSANAEYSGYVQEGLVALYDGIQNTQSEHNYSTNLWTDLTGNNTNGATINGATWTPNGLLFDGSNDFVNMNSVLMPEIDSFTIDLLLSINKYPSSQYYILGQNTSSNTTNRTGLVYTGSQLGIWSPNVYLYTGDTPKLTEKVNMTLMRNGDDLEIWINGEKIKYVTKSGLKIYAGNTILGRWGYNSTFYFDGIIYSLKKYNRAISEEEIQQNYNVDKLRFN